VPERTALGVPVHCRGQKCRSRLVVLALTRRAWLAHACAHRAHAVQLALRALVGRWPVARRLRWRATSGGAGRDFSCCVHAQFMAELATQSGEAMVAELEVLLPACIEAMGSSSASVRQAAVQTMVACGKVSFAVLTFSENPRAAAGVSSRTCIRAAFLLHFPRAYVCVVCVVCAKLVLATRWWTAEAGG